MIISGAGDRLQTLPRKTLTNIHTYLHVDVYIVVYATNVVGVLLTLVVYATM